MTGSTDGSWQSVQAARFNFPLYHLMLRWYSLTWFMLAKCSSWILIASIKSIFSHGLLTRTPRVTTPAMYQRLLFHLFYWLLVPISASDFKLQRSIWDALMRIQVKLVGIQAKQSVLSGWWFQPLWKMMEFVSWDLFLPNCFWKVMSSSHHQPVMVTNILTFLCSPCFIHGPNDTPPWSKPSLVECIGSFTRWCPRPRFIGPPR